MGGEVCRAPRNMDAEAIVRDHNAALVSPAGVDELRQLVEECIPWLEHSFLDTHSGPCTPETPCDMNCVNNTALGNLLGRVRRLTRLAAAPTEAGQ